jgi:hypothetical protein
VVLRHPADAATRVPAPSNPACVGRRMGHRQTQYPKDVMSGGISQEVPDFTAVHSESFLQKNGVGSQR